MPPKNEGQVIYSGVLWTGVYQCAKLTLLLDCQPLQPGFLP